jgi:tetratricopeptide (TPR) repeat protein
MPFKNTAPNIYYKKDLSKRSFGNSHLFFFPFFIFYSLFFVNVFSQTKDPDIESGIKYIYHINFDSANFKFNTYIKNHPSNPEGYFFLAMCDWWKINLNKQNESTDDEFYEKVNRVIELADNILDKNENDFNALFYKGGALGYRGLLRSIRDSWIKAAEDGKEALNLFHRAIELQPGNKNALFGIGIYNYFADYVPEKYPMLKPLLIIFPKGDKVKGLLQIKEIANGDGYASTEALYTLAYLYISFEKNFIESEIYSKILFELFPENPIFEKYLCSSYIGLAKFAEATEGWKSILQKCETKVQGYDNPTLKREANYYVALSLIKVGKISEAEQYLKNCIDITQTIDKEDTSFGVFANLLFGMYYDLMGNHSEAIRYYDKVLNMKNFDNSQQQAEKYKKNGYKI